VESPDDKITEKEDHASNDDAIRIAYSRDQIALTSGPDYVVAPESTEQIQEIMLGYSYDNHKQS
jgi:FAD/FMN-containing dehydrogenase